MNQSVPIPPPHPRRKTYQLYMSGYLKLANGKIAPKNKWENNMGPADLCGWVPGRPSRKGKSSRGSLGSGHTCPQGNPCGAGQGGEEACCVVSTTHAIYDRLAFSTVAHSFALDKIKSPLPTVENQTGSGFEAAPFPSSPNKYSKQLMDRMLLLKIQAAIKRLRPALRVAGAQKEAPRRRTSRPEPPASPAATCSESVMVTLRLIRLVQLRDGSC